MVEIVVLFLGGFFVKNNLGLGLIVVVMLLVGCASVERVEAQWGGYYNDGGWGVQVSYPPPPTPVFVAAAPVQYQRVVYAEQPQVLVYSSPGPVPVCHHQPRRAYCVNDRGSRQYHERWERAYKHKHNRRNNCRR